MKPLPAVRHCHLGLIDVESHVRRLLEIEQPALKERFLPVSHLDMTSGTSINYFKMRMYHHRWR